MHTIVALTIIIIIVLYYAESLILRMTYSSGINVAFDKNCVINNKPSSLQFSVGDKSWAATSNVHIRLWLPEGTT